MLELMEEKDHYLSQFAALEKTAKRDGFAGLRQSAIERFAERGLPSLHDEEWRFTNVAPIVQAPFRLAGKEAAPKLREVPLARRDAGGLLLTFVNGFFAPELSQLPKPAEGLVVAGLGEVVARNLEWVEPHLGRYAAFDEHAFVALNTAFFRDGAFVRVGPGREVEQPIHLLYLDSVGSEPVMAPVRNLFLLGPGSRAAVSECYVGREGMPDGVHFTNAVTEVVLEDGAALDHYKIQREGREAFHVGVMQVQQSAGSSFSSHAVTFGGALSRSEANVVLDGERCECTLNGLYRAAGRQLVDNHTFIDHARPNCASHELYKGILEGRGHGVFNGKIRVRPDAQKTDAKQTNQTLLLSDDAVIDTKPQLEIFADDVKCTHGATVGQLDDAAMFYLRSRGLGPEEARRLLIFAFANDIVRRIQIEHVRHQLEEFLLTEQHLAHGRESPEAP